MSGNNVKRKLADESAKSSSNVASFEQFALDSDSPISSKSLKNAVKPLKKAKKPLRKAASLIDRVDGKVKQSISVWFVARKIQTSLLCIRNCIG
jgi:hypothetical protein